MGGDACRLASAAFVTLSSLEDELERGETLPWGMIKLYYAAFYAGHSLLRLLGQSCSYLDPVHVTQLRRLAAAVERQPGFVLETGLYHCILNSEQTGFSLTRARGRVGGAHETFWKIFGTFLEETTEQVLLGRLAPDDARNVFLKLDALRTILQFRGAGSSWLSQVRNEIQYRLALGVWPPSRVNRSGRETLARLAKQWERDPMDIDLELVPGGDLGKFVAACAFTGALCRTILARIAARSSAGARCFAKDPLQRC